MVSYYLEKEYEKLLNYKNIAIASQENPGLNEDEIRDKLKSQNKSSDDIKKELGNEFTRILKLVNDNIIQDKTSEDILKILEKDFMKTDDPTANEFNIKDSYPYWSSTKNGEDIEGISFFSIITFDSYCSSNSSSRDGYSYDLNRVRAIRSF